MLAEKGDTDLYGLSPLLELCKAVQPGDNAVHLCHAPLMPSPYLYLLYTCASQNHKVPNLGTTKEENCTTVMVEPFPGCS